MTETREERDDGSELRFAVVMVVLSVLIFLAIRRSEGSDSD